MAWYHAAVAARDLNSTREIWVASAGGSGTVELEPRNFIDLSLHVGDPDIGSTCGVVCGPFDVEGLPTRYDRTLIRVGGDGDARVFRADVDCVL